MLYCTMIMNSSRSYARPKIFSVTNVLQCRVLSSEAMSSASAVIGDCDGVPGQQSRCTLCKQPLRGTHSHPGQWKSQLQQFLLLKVR